MEKSEFICSMDGVVLKPLLVPPSPGPSLSNPSVSVLRDGRILVNIRNLNYALYHSEAGRFEHSWGPLIYVHREDDQTLTTHNIFCELDGDLNVKSHTIVETGIMDSVPLWNFVGLEDARIANWNEKIYMTGVRRDTTPNGVGRMEVSEIIWNAGKAFEVSRMRIPAPSPDNSYCEKNWMPVADLPFHYVKWTNPTELVHFDPATLTTETKILSELRELGAGDLRGGSQVIRLNDKYLALVHETKLFSSEAGKKNAIYRHRFVLWNSDFNLIEASRPFSFMGGSIEFCCGMAELGDKLLISFGFQDNAAFLASVPKSILGRFLKSYE